MWAEVTVSDVVALQRMTQLMRGMGEQYDGLTAAEISFWVHDSLGSTWFWSGSGFEIALRIVRNAKYGRYQLANVAIDLGASPAQALDRVVEKCFEFMQPRGIQELFALRPKGVPAHAEAFFTLVLTHPQVLVAVEQDGRRVARWTLRPRAIPASGARQAS